MTVKELIELLNEMPEDAVVRVEDQEWVCTYPVSAVDIYKRGNKYSVIIS